MTANIEEIRLWDTKLDGNCDGKKYNGIPLVRVNFKFPCTYTTFNLKELLEILKLWIKGEEMVYPQSKGFQGRWMLFDEIKKVFDEKEVKNE